MSIILACILVIGFIQLRTFIKRQARKQGAPKLDEVSRN